MCVCGCVSVCLCVCVCVCVCGCVSVCLCVCVSKHSWVLVFGAIHLVLTCFNVSHLSTGFVSEVHALFLSCHCLPSQAVPPWQALSATTL